MKKSEQQQSISVVLPAYNEEGNIRRTILELIPVLEDGGFEYEIIVVNDGSRDKTGEIVTALQKDCPGLSLLTHEKNQGYGKTVWDGILAAKKELVFFADSDGQFDFADLKTFVGKIGPGQAVLGFRKKRQDHFIRLVNAFAWKCLVFTLFRLRVKDLDCAFKLFNRKEVQHLKICSFGAVFSVELLYKLQTAGVSYVQLPVTHRPRVVGKSTGGNIKVILRSFKELFRFYQARENG